MQIQWQSPLVLPSILENHVHIWKIEPAQITKDLLYFKKILSEKETTRANKLTLPKVKNNFIISRGILRALLAKYTRQKPEELIFEENQYGKLFLKTSSNIFFNLSHSNDLTLLAFTLKNQIGIDVEFIRQNIDIESIAKKYFSSRETLELLNVSPEKKIPAFFNCWARKEAFIKAIGLGLSYQLSKFDVDVTSFGTKQIPINIKDPVYAQQNWQLFSLGLEENYAAAMVVENPVTEILFLKY